MFPYTGSEGRRGSLYRVNVYFQFRGSCLDHATEIGQGGVLLNLAGNSTSALAQARLLPLRGQPGCESPPTAMAENHVTIVTKSHDPTFTGFILPRRTSARA